MVVEALVDSLSRRVVAELLLLSLREMRVEQQEEVGRI